MMHQMFGYAAIMAVCLVGVLLAGCTQQEQSGGGGGGGGSSKGSVTKAPYGKLSDGTAVDVYTLKNSKGAEARIITYGGTVTYLSMPDKDGKFSDVVLGFDNLEGYTSTNNTAYFGALVGRYGNRIGKAKFTLDGKEYTLPANNNGNTLHGGTKGFDKVVWTAKEGSSTEGPSLELTYLSKDGEQGFPGNLNVKAVYTLTDDNALKLEYTATTDKDTVVNLTQHSYFNLAGKGSILDHEVQIMSDQTTPVDAQLIPTGGYKSVDGTPFDFRKPTKIGARIDDKDTQLQYGPGYDHNWVINKPMGQMGLMARVTEATTGRVLEVSSDQPGLQFYSGNFLDGTLGGNGWKFEKRTGFCMEPQHYPDSPNRPEFPSTELKPGETYKNTIIYKFSVAK